MSGSALDWTKALGGRRPLSLAAACAWLTLSLALAYAPLGFFAARNAGVAGWQAAAVAALVCWFAFVLTLAATALTRGPLRGFYALAYGVLFGFAIPFAAGTALKRVAWLDEAGVFGLMAAFYLVALALGTALSVRLVGPTLVSKPAGGISKHASGAPDARIG